MQIGRVGVIVPDRGVVMQVEMAAAWIEGRPQSVGVGMMTVVMAMPVSMVLGRVRVGMVMRLAGVEPESDDEEHRRGHDESPGPRAVEREGRDRADERPESEDGAGSARPDEALGVQEEGQ